MRYFILQNRRLIINSGELVKLIDYYKEKKLAHAYLITTNNIEKCMQVLLKVIKNIFCNEKFSEDCNKCSLCHLIDKNTLPSLLIIEPDGSFIRKEQIQDLKHYFNKESIYTRENIYIIKNCEKLNKEAANTMLKFLEEPNGNVIGFFITNEIDNVMLTIQSRCQHIEVLFDNDVYEKYNLTKEDYEKYLNVIKKYINSIEKDKKSFILNNRIFLSDFEKNEIKVMFEIILDLYKSELESRFLKDKGQSIVPILKENSIKNIQKKINLIIELLNEINYNVNLDLLLDRFIIEMDGIDNEVI